MKRPTGDYLKLSQVPYLHQGSAQIVVPLVESEFSAAIEGVYTLVARVTVGWSETYVNPLIPDEPIDLNYTVSGGEALVYRGAKTLKSTFTIKLKQIGFDLNTVKASDGSAKTISFKSGMCSGRSFVITRCEYSASDDSWVLTCRRGVDSSVSQTFPNSIFPISAGDQFILLNINMPDLYVHTAMQRLYDTALADLKHYSNPQFVVSPEIDNLQMARSPQTLKEGMYMPVEDADINIDDDILIDGVTITEKGNELRRFDVTLRNDKIYNRFSKIATSLSNLESSIEEAKKNANNTPLTSGEDSIILGGSSPQISIWEHINVGTEEKPEWAVIPKDRDNNPVAIVTKSFISFGGVGNPSPSTGVTRLSALQDVDVELSTINEGEVLTWNGEKWENRSIKTGLDEAALGSYLTSKGYKTKEDNDELYASLTAFNTLNTSFSSLNSAFNTLNTRVTTFLDSENLNGTIDRWREVENFLLGYTDQQTLANILATKADLSLVNQAIERLTTVEGKVQTLSEILCIDADGDIYIGGVNKANQKRNFYVYGGLSFGGKGTSGSGGSGATALGGLSDVALTTLSNGQSLVYENGYWINKQAGINTTQLWNILGSSGAEKLHIDRLPDLSSKYLSLNGGTLTSSSTPLTINRQGSANRAIILYQIDNKSVGVLGFDYTGDLYVRPRYSVNSEYYNVLHTGNFADYALSRKGGELKGDSTTDTAQHVLTLNTDNTIVTNLRFKNQDSTKANIGYSPVSTLTGYRRGMFIHNATAASSIGIEDNGTPFYNSYTLIHTGNYADTTDKRYLQLSGGEMSGDIILPAQKYIRAVSGSGYAFLGVDVGNVLVGNNNYNTIIRGASLSYNDYTLIHSGNIGDYALKYTKIGSNNASTLPSLNSFGLWNEIGAYVRLGYSSVYNIAFRTYRGDLLSQWEKSSAADADWKTIAFTDSNVASAQELITSDGNKYAYHNGTNLIFGRSSIATNIYGSDIKLRPNGNIAFYINPSGNVTVGNADLASTTTKLYVNGGIRFAPRTIWGQSFDGTGDVSGTLILHKATSGGWARAIRVRKSNDEALANIGFFGEGDTLHYIYIGGTYQVPHLTVFPSGNVSINKDTDSGYKLDVNGTLNAGAIKGLTLRSYAICIECDEDGVLGSYSSEINNFKGNIYLQTRNGNTYISHVGGLTEIRSNTTIGGTLGVTGKSTLGELSANATTLTSLVVSGNATIGSSATHATLNIYGGLNVNVGDTILNGNITQLSGTALLQGLTAGDTTVSSLTSEGTILADNQTISTGQSGNIWSAKGEFDKLLPRQESDSSIGSSSMRWANTYLHDVNVSGDLWLKPVGVNYGSRLIFGDVRSNTGEPYCYIGEDEDDVLTIYALDGIRLLSNTIIGTEDGNSDLTVYGNLVLTGTITFGTASDIRLKDNITVSNCDIYNNVSLKGGAIYAYNLNANNNVTIKNSKIYNNY